MSILRFKQLFLGLIIGLLFGGGFTMVWLYHILQNNYLEVYECEMPYELTVKNFTRIINHNQHWQLRVVPCTLPQTLDSSRISMFNICHSGYATALINTPETRASTAFIPCQIAIFERDGKCYLARLNLSLIGFILGGLYQDMFTNRIDIDQRELLLPIIGTR